MDDIKIPKKDTRFKKHLYKRSVKVTEMNSITDLLPNSPTSSSVSGFWDLIPSSNKGASLIEKLTGLKYEFEIRLLKFNNVNVDRPSKDDGYSRYLQFPDKHINELAKEITSKLDTNDEKMYKIEQWVLDNIEYKSDLENYGQNEYWSLPTMTVGKGSGDCIANYEEIWTESGLKKVGDLKVEDMVLSYDFDKKDYCYKPIIKIWEKGKLPVFRVNFRNGTWLDVTKSHSFWTRRTQKPNPYVKTKLKDIDLSRWWKRKIPCVKKLPYGVKDIEWLTEDICFVIGYFLAEGWIEKKRYTVCIGGHDIPEHIVPILDRHGVSYNINARKSDGLSTVKFNNSKLKKYLYNLKTNSFNINMPLEIFYLPKNKLQKLIDGHFLGDGHYSSYPNKTHPDYQNNKEKTYSTSSYQLAYDLQRIHLQLGKPLYMWLQKDHKGVGNKPIWRLSHNTNSYFSRNHGYTNVSEVSIKNYEYLCDTEVRDFTIKDTHTFVSKFGILCHNCEDMAFLIHSLGLHAGVPHDRLRTYGGFVKIGDNSYQLCGHGLTAFKRESDNKWIVLDGSYYTTDKLLNERTPMKDDYNYVEDFFYITRDGTVDAEFSNFIRNPKGGLVNEIV